MLQAVLLLFIFAILNGLTASIIFHLIKKYFFKHTSDFTKAIWIGIIISIICFALGMILIFGMENKST
jgi:hypothetical protein